VTSWKEQVELFKAAQKEYGHIDHVFANAGITQTCSLLEDDVDEHGDLLPPKLNTLNVNLTGCIYTVKLGIYYLKKNPRGGSIVMTGSVSSFTCFPVTDYSAFNHLHHSARDISNDITQQRPNTPSSASYALCAPNSIPDCPYASTPLRPRGQTRVSYPDASSLLSVRIITSLQMLWDVRSRCSWRIRRDMAS
jgi:hypothetical protein